MLFLPLLVGAAIGTAAGGQLAPGFLLATVVLSLFWLRTPIESWFGTSAMRAQSASERQLVLRFLVPLATVAAVSGSALVWVVQSSALLWLAPIAASAFVVQVILWRMGRAARMPSELVGACALTATAPAAYCVVTGRLDSTAWLLWLLNWMFAANQVHFVWLSIRGSRAARWSQKLAFGWTFLVGQVALLSILLVIRRFHPSTNWVLLAYAPALFRGVFWFLQKPRPVKVRRLGWTELFQNVLFSVLLIAAFVFGM
jgi:hypothetical protein